MMSLPFGSERVAGYLHEMLQRGTLRAPAKIVVWD